MAISITSTRDRSSLYPAFTTINDGERLADLVSLIDGVDQNVLRASVDLLAGNNPSVSESEKRKISSFLNEISRLTQDRRFAKYVDIESDYYVQANAWQRKEDDEGKYYTSVNSDGTVRADVYEHEGQFYWTVYYDGQNSGFANGYGKSLMDAQHSAEEVMNNSTSPLENSSEEQKPKAV